MNSFHITTWRFYVILSLKHLIIPLRDKSEAEVWTPAFTGQREARMRSADRNKTNDGIKERNGHTEGLSINSLISPQLARIMHRNLPSAPSDNCFLKSGRWKTFKKTKNKKTQSHSEEKSMRSFLRNWVSENSTPDSRLRHNRRKSVKAILCWLKSQNQCEPIIIITANYQQSSCELQLQRGCNAAQHSNLQLHHYEIHFPLRFKPKVLVLQNNNINVTALVKMHHLLSL